MTFSKSFPKPSKTSTYPQWEEITLTQEEEEAVQQEAKKENIAIMKECVDDAQKIMIERNLKPYQTDLVNIAVALFEKRASHEVYHKEAKAKEKFDQLFK